VSEFAFELHRLFADVRIIAHLGKGGIDLGAPLSSELSTEGRGDERVAAASLSLTDGLIGRFEQIGWECKSGSNGCARHESPPESDDGFDVYYSINCVVQCSRIAAVQLAVAARI
jgi:hypothetical protein